MGESSLFFSIPTLITQVRAVAQPNDKKIHPVPDGPMIVLVCNNIVQMSLINENVLHNRTVRSFVNIDVGCQPPSFGAYLCIDDVTGIDLEPDEIELLCSMTSPDYQEEPWPDEYITTRIMFGNGVDISIDDMQMLIEGKQMHGRFNIIIGYDTGNKDGAMYYVPANKTPIIIDHSGSYTTMPYENFVESIMRKFRSE